MLTSTPIEPCRSSTSATACSTDALLRVSMVTTPTAWAMDAATSASRSADRAARTTVAPSAWSARPTASPMSALPPTTRATTPVNPRSTPSPCQSLPVAVREVADRVEMVPHPHHLRDGQVGEEVLALVHHGPVGRPRARLPVVRHLDEHLPAVGLRPDRASVTIADGTALEADFVVGADGVHSLVRRTIDPSAPAGRYVGLTNFGGITRGTALAVDLQPEAWHFVFGRRAFFGAVPTPGGDVVWFVNAPRAEISREERATTSDEQWRDWLAELVRDDAGPGHALIT